MVGFCHCGNMPANHDDGDDDDGDNDDDGADVERTHPEMATQSNENW